MSTLLLAATSTSLRPPPTPSFPSPATGFIVAYAGIWLAVLIVVISSFVTMLTTLSISAITTNGKVAGGGAYFLLSRSLGAEWGGAIGILFALANAVAIALYLIGFAESLVFQLGGTWISSSWDLRIIAFISLAAIIAICFVGIEYVVKFQLGLLITIVLAIASFMGGCFMSKEKNNTTPSFAGFQADGSLRNTMPDFDLEEETPASREAILAAEGSVNFATCIGIFFPAVTGIMGKRFPSI